MPVSLILNQSIMNIDLSEAAIHKHVLIIIEMMKSKEVNIDIKILKIDLHRPCAILEPCIQINSLTSTYEMIEAGSVAV